jgi:hypothetical protein
VRRMDGNPDVWEGFCHSCSEWVPLVSNKKKGTTWFRHAYKCHTHPKIKDAPKRRRETNHGRAIVPGTTNEKVKTESSPTEAGDSLSTPAPQQATNSDISPITTFSNLI